MPYPFAWEGGYSPQLLVTLIVNDTEYSTGSRYMYRWRLTPEVRKGEGRGQGKCEKRGVERRGGGRENVKRGEWRGGGEGGRERGEGGVDGWRGRGEEGGEGGRERGEEGGWRDGGIAFEREHLCTPSNLSITAIYP